MKTRCNIWAKVLLIGISIFTSTNIVNADNFRVHVGEQFYLPIPDAPMNDSFVNSYAYSTTSYNINVTSSSGYAEVTSFFTGTETIECYFQYIYYPANGYPMTGTSREYHRVTCISNDISISAPKTKLKVGESMQMSYDFASYTYGVTPQITWGCSNNAISIDRWGFVTAYSPGTVTVTAQSNLGGNTAKCTIVVEELEPTGVTISPANSSVYLDGTLQLRASVTPSGAPQNVSWSLYSGSTSTATVSSSGLVRGLSKGSITVKATASNGVYGTTIVSVVEPPFTMQNTTPTNNATNQSVFITPTIWFSSPIIQGDNFMNIALRANNQTIAGKVTISNTALVFTPDKPLSANTTYTLTIPAKALKNKWGTPYAQAVSLSFTTGELEKLTLTTSVTDKFVAKGTVVKLTASKPNAQIYYTTDGSVPTETSTLYTTGVVIQNDMQLKAFAALEGYANSETLVKDYIISNAAVVRFYPNDNEPLFEYENIIPSVTFSNRIEPSANLDKISFQQNGIGEIEKTLIVCDSAIYIVPTHPLEYGVIYNITVPANAIQTWQGEYNEATKWSFTTGDYVKSIAVNGHEIGMALKSNNSMLIWGSKYSTGVNINGSFEYDIMVNPASFMSDVCAISSGYMHHAAIKTDGSLWMWGRQYCGEFGNNSNVASATPVKVLDGVHSVSAGGQTTAIIKKDGSLWMCGRNDFGQVGNSNATSSIKLFTKILDNVTQAVSSWGCSFAITNENKLYGWGRNDKNQLLQSDNLQYSTPTLVMEDIVFIAASATESEYFAAITTTGDLNIWGEAYSKPIILDKNVSNVSIGKNYIEYVKTDGSLWAFGSNNYGQLGDGTSNNASSPRKIMDGVSVVKSAPETTFALKENGSVWSWGRNKNNILGNENNFSELSLNPVEIIQGMPYDQLKGIKCYKKKLYINPDTYGVVPVYAEPLIAEYDTIVWESSDPQFVTIDNNGVVYGVAEGESEITATIYDNKGNNYFVKCAVVVGTNTTTNSVDEKINDILVWADKRNIFIQGVPWGENITVYTTSGLMLCTNTVQESVIQINVYHPGVYIVQTESKIYKVVCH